MAGFALDPRLENDTVHVTDLALCRVLLMNDSRYPWLILVPMQDDLREFHDLSPEDQTRLMAEITLTTQVLHELHTPDKLNVGALGNIVNQLHIHVLGRFDGDPAWPGPVWGLGKAVPYEMEEIEQLVGRVKTALQT